MDSLKTCFFGGYDKLDTLKYIDTITSEIYMLESAIEKKKNGDNFVIPGETGQRKLKGSALGGFAKPDVDSYICALLGKAAELREAWQLTANKGKKISAEVILYGFCGFLSYLKEQKKINTHFHRLK